MRWRARFLAALAAVTLVTLPLASRAVDPYEVDVIIPLTGPAAFLGRAEQTSLGVVEGLANKDGGINGRPVKFVIQDDQSNPQIGVQLLSGILTKHPPLIMGSTLDAVCRAMAAVVKANGGPVHWCFSNAFHPDDGSWSFSSSFSTLDVYATAFRYVRERGWRRIAYLTSTDATGQDFERSVETLMARPENKPLTIVAREHFVPRDISVAAQVARIKATDAQVVFAVTTGTPFGTVLHGAVDGGLKVPIITPSGNETYAQVKAYAGIMPNNLYFTGIPSLTPADLPRGPVRTAIEKYQQAFKPTGVRPDIGANQAWDAALIVIGALRKLGTDASAEQLRDYIWKLRGWDGINGSYDFTALPQRGVGGNWIVLQQWDPLKNAFVGVSRPGGAPR